MLLASSGFPTNTPKSLEWHPQNFRVWTMPTTILHLLFWKYCPYWKRYCFLLKLPAYSHAAGFLAWENPVFSFLDHHLSDSAKIHFLWEFLLNCLHPMNNLISEPTTLLLICNFLCNSAFLLMSLSLCNFYLSDFLTRLYN